MAESRSTASRNPATRSAPVDVTVSVSSCRNSAGNTRSASQKMFYCERVTSNREKCFVVALSVSTAVTIWTGAELGDTASET